MNKIKLDDLKAKPPFEVPEGYFDDLSLRIQSQIDENQDKPVFTVSWSWKRTLITTAAASVVGVLVWLTYPEQQHSLGKDTLAEVKTEDIIKYMQANEIKPNELVLTEENPENITDSTLINELDVSDADIIKHLDPETIKETI